MNPDGNALRTAILTLFETNRNLVSAKIVIKRGPDQEDAIHDLRVATKKIRTVFRLVEFLVPDQFRQKKQIAGLRTLFQAAGVLRELQVDEGVLWVFEDLHLAIYRRLSKQLAAERKSAQPLYERSRKAFEIACLDRPEKKLRKILAGISEEDLVAKTKELVKIRMGQMHEVMPRTYDPERVHKARIYLKEAMYLMGLLTQAGYSDALDAGLLDGAKAAAEVAGDWHDREVFYEWLQIQLRPGAALMGKEADYRLLLQDLHVQTRNQVVAFRKALNALQKLHAQVVVEEAEG
jgi:CHAD domain-containing protein